MYRSQETGWSVESKLLQYIGKQLDRLAGLLKAVSGTIPTMLSQLTSDAIHRTVTDTEKSTWNAKQAALGYTAENTANKQNSLTTDGTGVKFATVDAVNTLVVKKSYIAYISQTGTNSPTEDIVLKDDLAVPVWSYSAVGTYLLTKASAFTSTKTIPNKAEPFIDNAGNKMTLERTSANVMTLKTYAAADTTVLANGVITAQYINIEVYL